MHGAGGKRVVFFGTLILAAILLGGCATVKPMALNDETEVLDLSKESVALFTVKTSNRYKPSYQPHVSSVIVWTNDNREKTEKYGFQVKEPHDKVENQYDEYLASISLAPGKYKLREIFGTSGTFPVRGFFGVPMYTPIELKPNKIVYLGRIEAVIRERKNDGELRAGPVVPLLDQAVTGFAGGTFDINVYDNYDKDIALFKQIYPLLNKYTVEKAVLPQWKKPTEEEMK